MADKKPASPKQTTAKGEAKASTKKPPQGDKAGKAQLPAKSTATQKKRQDTNKTGAVAVHPGGRPTKYQSEFAEQAFKLCLLGATDKDLSNFFGVCERTINGWKDEHPEFLQSLKGGKEQADAEVANRLYRRALGYTHDAVKIFNEDGKPLIVPYTEQYAPDTVACIFWLKNRQPHKWRDKVEVAGELDVNVFPVEKLDEIHEKALAIAAENQVKVLGRMSRLIGSPSIPGDGET